MADGYTGRSVNREPDGLSSLHLADQPASLSMCGLVHHDNRRRGGIELGRTGTDGLAFGHTTVRDSPADAVEHKSPSKS